MDIFNDMYLWIGVALLVVSFGGIFWIMRSIQKKQEKENAMPSNYADFFTPPPQAKVTISPKTPPGPAAAIAVASAPVSEASRVSIETVADQLGRIEEHLQIIVNKLDQPAAPTKVELNEEIKTLLQNIKPQASSAAKNDSAQISELTAKIEKIYQVLASISGSAR